MKHEDFRLKNEDSFVKCQGLAHFLEHMLFMGSERYPDENEAEEYLSAHGGYSNAYTDVEHTTFYFELEPGPGVLNGALDRWSAFFICPLLKEDCLKRELDAVNSEFQGVEQNDTCRQQQLLSHDAKPGHPCCNFLWGNAESLQSATREDLLSFWQTHYNAAVSKLVLLGGESLDELEAMAHKYFDELRAKQDGGTTQFSAGGAGKADITGLLPPATAGAKKPPPMPPPPQAPTPGETPADLLVPGAGSSNPFAQSAMGELLLTLPVADAHTISLVWPLPPLRGYYEYATFDYISHLLGHEGPGSLTSRLKQQGWIVELMCGVDLEDGLQSNSMFSMMTMELCLTDAGLACYEDVVSAVYEYLAMMRADPGPQEWVFGELKAVREMRFRFHQETSADEYVQALAADMLTYAPEDTLSGGYLYKEWDAEFVVALLGYMVPWNMRSILASNTEEHTAKVKSASAAAEKAAKKNKKSKKKESKPPKKKADDVPTAGSAEGGWEPWFGVPFARESFDADLLKAWAVGTPPADEARRVTGLSLVPPNDFIATEFELLSLSAADEEADCPTKLPGAGAASAALEVWHKADSAFRTPRATMCFKFASPGLGGSVLSSVFSAIYVELLRDGFNETVYMAEQAGIDIELRLTDRALELSAYGFSHKILTCARAYLKYIDTYRVSTARFEYLLEDFRRNCKNQNLAPESHANYLRMHILRADLESTNPQRMEFANSDECTPANLQRWISENVAGKTAEGSGEREEPAHAAAFMIGNVSQEETAAFGAEAAATFGVATAPGGWREYTVQKQSHHSLIYGDVDRLRFQDRRITSSS